MSEPLINAGIGALSALVIVVGIWYNSRPAGTTTINWSGVISYAIVGVALGGYGGYVGIPVTPEWIGIQVLAYGGVIAIIDNLLAGFLKTPTQTFVVKYTGHNYFPEFILNLKDGTEQRFNNSLTGICCSIWVVMPGKVAQFVMPRLAAWYPGFTVTPAFLQGTSPYVFTLNVVTGMDSDGTPLKQMKIDWKDGSPVEIVPLSLNKDGNPAATVKHTYVFNGS